MNSVDYKSIRNRPRFKINFLKTEEEIYLAFEKIFIQNKDYLSGTIKRDSATLFVKSTSKEYWSPQLELRWEVDEENLEFYTIRGLYGPRPSIWTFFIFLYTLGLTLVGFFGLLWIVQYRINLSNDLVIWAWVGILIIILTYLASWVGKRKAKKELEILKNFMEKVVEELNTNL